MHSVVLARYVYFVAGLFFHLALAVVAGIYVREPEPVAGGPAVFFLAIFGTLTLLGLLGFDLNRTRTGTAYFCFVCKIWFELSVMTLLLCIHIVIFVIVFGQNRGNSCISDAHAPDDSSCTPLQITWAFQIIVAAIILLYVAFLGIVSALYHRTTPRVFCAAVRDFPWGSRAVRHNKEREVDIPIYFPNVTLPTFDEVFSNVHKRVDEGQAC